MTSPESALRSALSVGQMVRLGGPSLHAGSYVVITELESEHPDLAGMVRVRVPGAIPPNWWVPLEDLEPESAR